MAKGFNWQGIVDNGDGTYNAENKRAKTRLLKEFHKQGVAVRSKKIGDDGYLLSPVGSVQKKRTRPSLGYRPRTVYPRRTIQVRRAPPRLGVTPHLSPYQPHYGSRPRIGSPTIGQRFGQWIRERAERKEQEQKNQIEQKKTEHRINEKMKNERIAQEHTETVEKIRQQEITARLQRERADLERHQIAQRMRTREAVHAYTGSPNTPRFEPKESKIDQGAIQNARDQQVTGE
jgi:hypothetical protein